jgi:hypothetical protein
VDDLPPAEVQALRSSQGRVSAGAARHAEGLSSLRLNSRMAERRPIALDLRDGRLSVVALRYTCDDG